MIKYSIILNTKGNSSLDVRFLLEEADPELEFILETPEELTNYIKQYEEDKNPEDESLFHDIRTKYIEFIKKDISSDLSADESMILLGFSIVGEKIYIIVKTFSLKLLSTFLEKIKIYCRENEIPYLGLDVNPADNPAAQRLYERLGYHTVGALHLDGVYDYTDSQGIQGKYEDWCIDMIKPM